MQKIGFIGLGMMGGPMAANLLEAGFTLEVYDLRRDAVDRLSAGGARVVADAAALADCDAVIVMVNTDDQAREVMEDLISALSRRPVPIFCMSTILPSTIREMGERAAAAGIGLLDAPVSGGPVVAELGGLAIMVGGEPVLFERARPVFEAMGNAIYHVGPLGTGLVVKLVNNLIAISSLPIVLEALRIGLEQGLDLSTMVEVIRASSGNTWLTQQWDQARLFLEFAQRDPSQLDGLLTTGLKDMALVARSCAQAGIEAPLVDHAIAAVEQHGAEGLRRSLAALREAMH